jgi:hypothetical protein
MSNEQILKETYMRAWNNVAMADHCIVLFCVLGTDFGGSTARGHPKSVGGIRAADLCVARRHFANSMGSSDSLAWAYETPSFAESDLALYSRRVLGQGSSEAAADVISTHRFVLQGQVLRFLNDPQAGGGICLRLTPRGSKRLDAEAASASVIPMNLRNVRLYRFMSGLTFAELELTISLSTSPASTPSVAHLMETIFAITHSSDRFYSGRLYWQHAVNANPEILDDAHTSDRSFTVTSLLEALTGMRSPDTRHFHCTVIRVDEALTAEEKREIVLRVSRRASTDYGIEPTGDAQTLMEVSSNVNHCVSIEGGATLVDGSHQLPFTREFVDGRWREVYLPLALISYHSFRWLQALCDKESFRIRFDAPSIGQLELLRRLRNAALQYRLAYRFAAIGNLTTHVRAHDLWRNAFRLPQLEKELCEDVSEISSYLQSIDEKRSATAAANRARIWRPVTTILSALASFVLGSELLGTLIRIHYEPRQFALLAQAMHRPEVTAEFEQLLLSKHAWEIAAQLIAGLLAALVAWKAWSTLPDTRHLASGHDGSHSVG